MNENSETATASQANFGTKSLRQEHISRWIQHEGFLSVDKLVGELGVSRMTVHRDLDELEAKGLLRKIRGGATVRRSTQFESSLGYRKRASVEAKRRIGEAASSLINSGDVIMIDDSTTGLALLPHLKQFEDLTVITNFTLLLSALKSETNINLISVGGQYESRHAAYVGMLSEKALAHLYADVLFASVSSMKGSDLYHQDQRIVAVKRAMMASADRRVLILDSSKVGQGALYRVCSVDEFTDVVFDQGIDRTVVGHCRDRDVNVIVA